MTISFDEWLQQGYEAGFCGPPLCETHDAVGTTEAEDTDFSEGFDPCIHVLRLYESPEVKAGVEANHAPSQWRASNRGLVKN